MWNDQKVVWEGEGATLIRGKLDGAKELGLHWPNFPLSHGHLSPLVVPKSMRTPILCGLLQQSLAANQPEQKQKILEAIDYLD